MLCLLLLFFLYAVVGRDGCRLHSVAVSPRLREKNEKRSRIRNGLRTPHTSKPLDVHSDTLRRCSIHLMRTSTRAACLPLSTAKKKRNKKHRVPPEKGTEARAEEEAVEASDAEGERSTCVVLLLHPWRLRMLLRVARARARRDEPQHQDAELIVNLQARWMPSFARSDLGQRCPPLPYPSPATQPRLPFHLERLLPPRLPLIDFSCAFDISHDVTSTVERTATETAAAHVLTAHLASRSSCVTTLYSLSASQRSLVSSSAASQQISAVFVFLVVVTLPVHYRRVESTLVLYRRACAFLGSHTSVTSDRRARRTETTTTQRQDAVRCACVSVTAP